MGKFTLGHTCEDICKKINMELTSQTTHQDELQIDKPFTWRNEIIKILEENMGKLFGNLTK